jgi:hypothetical protein
VPSRGFFVSYRTAEPAAGESDRHCLRVATPNSIPWSSTAKFSRNGVLVARLRVSYARLVQSSDLGDAGRKPRLRNGEPAVRLAAGLLQLSELTFPRSPFRGSVDLVLFDGMTNAPEDRKGTEQVVAKHDQTYRLCHFVVKMTASCCF